MIRTTASTLDNFWLINEINDKNELALKIKSDKSLRTSIAAASFDFHSYFDNYLDSGKVNNKALISMLNYTSRAYSRPTPYGFFSGILDGTFNQETNISFYATFKNLLQVDAEWFYSLIQKLESIDEILIQLKVVFNPQCYALGSRFKNPFVSDYGFSKELNNRSNIRYTKQMFSALTTRQVTVNRMSMAVRILLLIL